MLVHNRTLELEAEANRNRPEKLAAHVVLLTNFIPPYRLPLYRELAARVSRLTVLVSTPMEANRNWNADWEGLDVEVQRCWSMQKTWRHATGFRDRQQVHVPLDTLSRLRRLRPDVVISAELGLRSLFSTVHHWRYPQVPLVLWATVSEHTEQGRGWTRQRLRRWLLRRADRVIVNGASGARYVGRFGVPKERIDYVPYTAVPGCFERLSTHRDPRHAHDLVFVGQLVERKGLLPFLEQLERWARSHPQRRIRFRIAGSGPLSEALRSRSTPDNLRLEWLGEQTCSQLASTLATSGILAFPSLADEWGLVVNEALAAGLPVLGSVYSQAVEELCEEGETGWRFRPDDPQDTQRALQRALGTPWQQLHAMRLHARSRTAGLTPAWAADRLVHSLDAALQDRAVTAVGSHVAKTGAAHEQAHADGRHETEQANARPIKAPPIKVLVVGQTPPPHHGQAVMIERLLHSPLEGVRLYHVRMAFSRSISDLGRVQLLKLLHLPVVILKIIFLRRIHGIDVLYYPPSGPSVVPVMKDIAILFCTRWLFRATILHVHAGGTSLVYPQLSGWLKPWFRWALYDTAAVIRLSAATPEDGLALRARREFLVANGIPDAFAERQAVGNEAANGVLRDTGRLRLLYVGALQESKGVLDLVRACGLLAQRGRDFRLELVGQCQSDAFRLCLVQLIDELGLTDRVQLTGVLTGQAKYDRFADADVFCFPSFYECEAFPLVLLEALSFRLPVVATRWRGIPSIIRDGQTGFLVETHCPVEVANRLEHLASDPELRQRMAEAARQHYLAEYTPDVFAQRMEQVFHEVGLKK